MSMSEKVIKLNEPTVFPDLNKSENAPADNARTELALVPLKYKHFRTVMQQPPEDQMHHLMVTVTGLSEDDLGELTPADAAQISSVIFKSMKEYMELGKTITKEIQQ